MKKLKNFLWLFLLTPILLVGQEEAQSNQIEDRCNTGIRFVYHDFPCSIYSIADSVIEEANSLGDFKQDCDKLIFPNKETIQLNGPDSGGDWFNVSPNKKLVAIYNRGKIEGKSNVTIYNSTKEIVGKFEIELIEPILYLCITDYGKLFILGKNTIKLLNTNGEIIYSVEHKVELFRNCRMAVNPDNQSFVVILEVEYDISRNRKAILLVLSKDLDILFKEETEENIPISISPMPYFNKDGNLIVDFFSWQTLTKILPESEKRYTWIFDFEKLIVNKYITNNLNK